MVSRILALLVWAAVAASVAFWGLRWFSKPMAVPPGTGAVALNSTPRGDLGRLLIAPKSASEAEQAEPTEQSALAARIQLVGVLAPRAGETGPGVALMAIDGKPARAYKLGHTVDGDQVVQAISQQGVQIGPQGAPAVVNLSLPTLPPPATGTLPSVSSGMAAPAAPAAMRPPIYRTPPPPAMGVPATGNGAVDGPAAGEATRRLPPRVRRQQLQQPNGMAPGQASDPAAPPPV